jgi:hypothetical protein
VNPPAPVWVNALPLEEPKLVSPKYVPIAPPVPVVEVNVTPLTVVPPVVDQSYAASEVPAFSTSFVPETVSGAVKPMTAADAGTTDRSVMTAKQNETLRAQKKDAMCNILPKSSSFVALAFPTHPNTICRLHGRVMW